MDMAQNMKDLVQWFAGGADHPYHKLYSCMREDQLWVAVTIGLDLAVATGYVLIAVHWWKNQRRLHNAQARRALGSLRNIFVFCGICGYAFIPIKMFWPAWRLYDFVMAFLVYYTWKYAWGARELNVVYNELGKSEQLAHDLEESREESRRKSFFLNAVSHDLRTPLNGLMLQVALAEISLDGQDPETLKQSLAEIKVSARATAELLNNFLELGRLDWGQDGPEVSIFEGSEFLRHVVCITQAPAEAAGLSLRVRAPASVRLRTDRLKLERILLNLVSNGVKFTRRGGVEVVLEPGGPGAEGDVRIHVADTGEGISPENQRRLFQEFFQVNNHERDRRKGFGLGLAIARRLAEQLGGVLSVQSTVGEGSRFTLHLPGVLVGTEPPAVVAPLGTGAGALPVAAGA